MKKVEISTWGDVKPAPHFLSLKEYLQCILSCLSNLDYVFFTLGARGGLYLLITLEGEGVGSAKVWKFPHIFLTLSLIYNIGKLSLTNLEELLTSARNNVVCHKSLRNKALWT